MEVIEGFDPVPVPDTSCPMGGGHRFVLVGSFVNSLMKREYEIIACERCNKLSVAWRETT